MRERERERERRRVKLHWKSWYSNFLMSRCVKTRLCGKSSSFILQRVINERKFLKSALSGRNS